MLIFLKAIYQHINCKSQELRHMFTNKLKNNNLHNPIIKNSFFHLTTLPKTLINIIQIIITKANQRNFHIAFYYKFIINAIIFYYSVILQTLSPNYKCYMQFKIIYLSSLTKNIYSSNFFLSFLLQLHYILNNHKSQCAVFYTISKTRSKSSLICLLSLILFNQIFQYSPRFLKGYLLIYLKNKKIPLQHYTIRGINLSLIIYLLFQ